MQTKFKTDEKSQFDDNFQKCGPERSDCSVFWSSKNPLQIE